MASPPAWSIGASKRAGNWKSSDGVPGPGSYDKRFNNKLQYPSWSMGTSVRNGEKFDNVPGPGSYNSPGKLNAASPSYSVGVKLSQDIERFSPGPGAYHSDKLRGKDMKSPSFSFRLKTQIPEEKGKIPGPGTYNQTSKALHERSPNYRFGSSTRDGLYRSGDSPGPGSYSARANTIGKGSTPKYRFGTSDRSQDDISTRGLPGPGAYNYRSEFGDTGKGMSLVPRRSENDLLTSGAIPGPGAYNVNLKNKHSQPAYRIGSASRDSLSRDNREVPGPGNYNFRNTNIGTNVRIGTSVRQPLNPLRNVPGPGTYSYRTKIGEGPKFVMNPRREDVTKSQNDRGMPGPGAYNPSLSAVKFHASSAGIGSGERNDLYASRTNPGPGQYNLRSGFKGPKWGFGHERRGQDVESGTPGPGYYKLPPKIGDVAPYAYRSYPLKIHM